MPAKPPNILYLNSHDTGRYVQPYGNAIPAPNIQWAGAWLNAQDQLSAQEPTHSQRSGDAHTAVTPSEG
ncbi:MAG: hypothetical protein M3016_00680 [Actinomycetota bacterium]|nr:hypothetical protein [Actinomycetota bacterium]